VPGATGYRGEKYSICLCSAEKKARAQMKFNSWGAKGGGEGRYVEQLAYLGYLLDTAVNQLGGLRQHGQANVGSP